MLGKKYHLVFLIFIFLYLLGFSALAEIQVTEMMYDPPGKDTGHEWIELFNSGDALDISGYYLFKGDKKYILSSTGNSSADHVSLLDTGDFALLTSSPTIFLADNPGYKQPIFVLPASFSLKNSGDNFILGDGTKNISVFYNVSLGAQGDGYSLCLFNYSWQSCSSTPGSLNKLSFAVDYIPHLKIIIPETIFISTEYTNLFKVDLKNKKDCSVKDTITVDYHLLPLNESSSFSFNDSFTIAIGCSASSATGKLNVPLPGQYRLCGYFHLPADPDVDNISQTCLDFTSIDPSLLPCDIKLDLILEEDLFFQQGQSVKFKPTLSDQSFPFQITYWIEDLFGRQVKEKVTTANTNQKSWKAKIDELDQVLWLKASVNPQCQDDDLANNKVQKMIIVMNQKNSPTEDILPSANSSLEIVSVSPKTVSFGEIIKPELDIYKGNTNKYSFSAWVEKDGKIISEKTKFNLQTKNIGYKIVPPIIIDSNCQGKISDGKATMVVEGLDLHAEKKIDLEGITKNRCSGSSISASSSSTTSSTGSASAKWSYLIKEYPKNIFPADNFDVKVLFQGDAQEHDFKIWAFVYRGSRCYSCHDNKNSREDNLISFSLAEFEERSISIPITVDDLDEGDYKIKVIINKDSQKTNMELVEEITVLSKAKENIVQPLSTASGFDKTADSVDSIELHRKPSPESSGIVVYRSSSAKAGKLLPYFLIICLGLFCLILIIDRRK